MATLSDNIDLSPFRHATLIQVCIGVHQFIMHFYDNLSISVESECLIYTTNGGLIEIRDYREQASAICKLISSDLADVELAAGGTLILKFVDGRRLDITVKDGPYESYQIAVKGKIYVV